MRVGVWVGRGGKVGNLGGGRRCGATGGVVVGFPHHKHIHRIDVYEKGGEYWEWDGKRRVMWR